jgi:hypothetical protein
MKKNIGIGLLLLCICWGCDYLDANYDCIDFKPNTKIIETKGISEQIKEITFEISTVTGGKFEIDFEPKKNPINYFDIDNWKDNYKNTQGNEKSSIIYPFIYPNAHYVVACYIHIGTGPAVLYFDTDSVGNIHHIVSTRDIIKSD